VAECYYFKLPILSPPRPLGWLGALTKMPKVVSEGEHVKTLQQAGLYILHVGFGSISGDAVVLFK
jgi:hypothetical protein